MLKVNELRIGNLVSDIHAGHTFYNEIKQITKERVYYGNFHSHPSDLKPIPLTEEWLLKFGFTRHHTDYGNGIIYIKDVPNNNEFIWGVYPFELGSGFVINKSKSLKYVHQLQNLYFALTGEELNIK